MEHKACQYHNWRKVYCIEPTVVYKEKRIASAWLIQCRKCNYITVGYYPTEIEGIIGTVDDA